jgi:hypothetical protein
VPYGDLPVDPVVLASLRETGWNLEDPVNRILAYPHTPFCTLIDGSLLKAPLTGREQRKKTMGRRRNRRSFRYDRRSAFQLGRVVMSTLLIILYRSALLMA